ncbi:hypothetical protein JTB14_032280 [Gonioctena quinquepunctata]|nr:hypothetical protein JTB14_032280 [Gonioctena quinquepunctata]
MGYSVYIQCCLCILQCLLIRKFRMKLLAIFSAVLLAVAHASTDREQWVAFKDQGGCGSCWAFSATGALEGQSFIKLGMTAPFSEQQLVDCSGSHGTAGCNGGYMQSAFAYVKDNGIMYEDKYPYEGKQGSCRYSGCGLGLRINGYISMNDENALLQAVGTVGPVSVSINGGYLQSYKGGILDDAGCSQATNHGVLAVGYGNAGVDYWLLKNSWGDWFGEAGYFRIRRGVSMCGINTDGSYPF